MVYTKIFKRSKRSDPVFSYKLRYIVGFWLVEMAISTNQKPTIYRDLYENTGPSLGLCSILSLDPRTPISHFYDHDLLKYPEILVV